MIRTKFLALCIFLIAFISIVNSITVTNVLRDTIDEEVRLDFDLRLDQTQKDIDQLLADLSSNTLDLCSDPTVQEIFQITSDSSEDLYAKTDMQTKLDTLQSNVNRLGFEHIDILPVHNDELYLWNTQTKDLEVCPGSLKEEWYQQIRKQPDNVLFFSEQTGNIRVIKGVYDINDWTHILGYLSLQVDTSFVISALQIKEGAAFLLDQNNRLILPYVDYYQLNELLDKAANEFVTVNGDEYLTLTKTIHIGHWKLVGLLSTEALYSKGNLVMKTFAATAGIAILLAVLVAFRLSDSITKPLMRLTRKMQSYKEYDLPPSEDSSEQYTGEVRILCESYNQMIAHIQSLIDEIYIAKIEEQEAEMRALQAQINPHFIYNTLDTINWMVAKYHATDIQRMIFLLASMLRNSLNNGENEISIRGELEQLKSYIGIHQIRTPDCFEVIYDVDESLMDFTIIKLILQPLVENVIQHGFQEFEDKGTIWIRIYREEDHIILQVINNGQEPDLDRIQWLLSPDNKEKLKSYGIRNVNTRLIKRYGPEYPLHYEYRDQKTYCTIRIPCS